MFVARITAVEVEAALYRRARGGTLSSEQAAYAVATLRRDLDRTFRVVELSPPVADLALEVAERHGLRGYDCVQLASALVSQRHRLAAGLGPVQLVSADAEFSLAAQAEGMGVADPTTTPDAACPPVSRTGPRSGYPLARCGRPLAGVNYLTV